MCSGGDCTLKENCLRHTGTVAGRQDFFGTPPFNREVSTCGYFWDDRPSQARISSLAYKFWQENHCPSGRDLEFWIMAESELTEKLRKSDYI